jgi:hypothetical protein
MLRRASGHDTPWMSSWSVTAQWFSTILRLQNEDDAADLRPGNFARVYHRRSKFDADLKFSTWLYSMASNGTHSRTVTR